MASRDTGSRWNMCGPGNWRPQWKNSTRLLSYNPGYAAGYFHGGQTLEKLGRIEEARELYRKGLRVYYRFRR